MGPVLVLPTSALKNSTSLSGLAMEFSAKEVIVNDQKWAVSRITYDEKFKRPYVYFKKI